MSYEIRALKSDDEKNWRELWSGYLEFYKTEVSEEVYANTFSRLIDPDCTSQQAFVAVKGEELVGLVHYIYHPHNWYLTDVCYLQDLYTKPSMRGEGVGTALIKAVYDAADANGAPNVYWLTQEFNHTARRLYDQVARLTPLIKYQR